MLFKKKKDFLERFPEIIWWEMGDYFEFERGWYVNGFFVCFSSDGSIFYKNNPDLTGKTHKAKFDRSFVNKSLKERRLETSCKFAEYDYQFVLDKVREEMEKI